MIIRLVAIFIGGGLGSIFRYYLGLRLNINDHFPYGTLVANILSSFILGGLLAYSLQHPVWKEQYKLFLMTGFCGGFSTFSTFSSETLFLMKNNQLELAFLYLSISLVLGVLSVYLGMKIMGGI